jgi:hypothetical protein
MDISFLLLNVLQFCVERQYLICFDNNSQEYREIWISLVRIYNIRIFRTPKQDWTFRNNKESQTKLINFIYFICIDSNPTKFVHFLKLVMSGHSPYQDYVQNIPGGNVSILGCHSVGQCTRVLFRTVSEIMLFHYTVPKFLIKERYYVLFLLPVFIVQVTKLAQFT